MGENSKEMFVIVSVVRQKPGAGAAVALRDESGRVLATWNETEQFQTREQAAMHAVVVGLRMARSRGASHVTVLAPHPELVRWLDGSVRVPWSSSAASAWRQARALSRAFVACQYELADVSGATPSIERIEQGSLLRAA